MISRSRVLQLFVAFILLFAGGLHAEVVNINTADAATLSRALVGIGEVRAQAIVAHRTQNGPFRSADDLALVKGIGPKVIERNRANIRVELALRRPAVGSTGAPPSGTAGRGQPSPRR